MRKNSPSSVFACAALALALSGCAARSSAVDDVDQSDEGAAPLSTCATTGSVKGIDVSTWDGDIYWHGVANTGMGFAFARVSDGDNTIDGTFASNWQRIKIVGMVRGAYQFFRPGQDPNAQANVMLQQLAAAGGLEDDDLPPVIDVEVTDGVSNATLVSHLRTWLERVSAETGKTPIIYISPGFFDQIGDPSDLGVYHLWVANWGVTCPNIDTHVWSNWAFWQSSDTGQVSGIDGEVDVDHFNGSIDALRAFAAEKRCSTDTDCNHGAQGTGRVCASATHACINACHSDADCGGGTSCAHTTPHWSCR